MKSPANNKLRVRGELLHNLARGFVNDWYREGFVKTSSKWTASIWRWAIGLAWKARLVLHWRMSRRVDLQTFVDRETACADCDHAEDTESGKYCKACGCAKWKWSELSVKNTREAHNCPLGRHAGSIATKKVGPDGKIVGGCVGCGQGTNGHANRVTEYMI